MKKEEMLEMFYSMPSFGTEWERHQPKELKEITKLVMDVSKHVHQQKGRFNKSYVNEVCNEIKQLAHNYQRTIVYKK